MNLGHALRLAAREQMQRVLTHPSHVSGWPQVVDKTVGGAAWFTATWKLTTTYAPAQSPSTTTQKSLDGCYCLEQESSGCHDVAWTCAPLCGMSVLVWSVTAYRSCRQSVTTPRIGMHLYCYHLEISPLRYDPLPRQGVGRRC